jgi:hypothetical protein
MNDEMDIYIGRCLKNWTAKHRLPADGRRRLLERAGDAPVKKPAPFSNFFAAFSNRWSSPGEHFYTHRHWQMADSLSLSINWSFHLVTHQKLSH